MKRVPATRATKVEIETSCCDAPIEATVTPGTRGSRDEPPDSGDVEFDLICPTCGDAIDDAAADRMTEKAWEKFEAQEEDTYESACDERDHYLRDDD